jgi:hypothetical protein
MRSVADELRVRNVERVLELPVGERVALALSLGDDDAAIYAKTNAIELSAAIARLRASRSRGRRPSAANFVESR